MLRPDITDSSKAEGCFGCNLSDRTARGEKRDDLCFRYSRDSFHSDGGWSGCFVLVYLYHVELLDTSCDMYKNFDTHPMLSC